MLKIALDFAYQLEKTEILTRKGVMRPKSGVQNAPLAGYRQLIETTLSIFDFIRYNVTNKTISYVII